MPEERSIEELGDAIRAALERGRPGDWYVQIRDKADVAHVPPPKPHTPSWYTVPFGIPIYIDESVPEGQFRIGLKAELVGA